MYLQGTSENLSKYKLPMYQLDWLSNSPSLADLSAHKGAEKHLI